APVRGYDGTSYYFQFILPNNSSNPLTYYMFYLPSDLPLESGNVSPGENTGGSGGGGGGGGGAAAVSEEPYFNIEKQEIREEYLQANLTTPYKFRTPELVVYEILITPAKSLGPVSVKVEQLRGLSKMKGMTQPFGIIYVHANIWVNAKELADRKGMTDARVRFRIESRWLAENNLYESKIRLLRWNQSRWVPLETEFKGRDANFTYFEAKTDGFSHFAISMDPFYQALPIYPMITPGISATPDLMETPSGTAEETRLPLAALAAAILTGIFLYRLIAERLK
ncbi:MAG: PGF-pre-PGF domain-containing protein, partial [Candidatus Methanoperedens sp.]|nr:PGF-pre-PGF domain-containing protein [Candidatus Methanoperedens sp.]